MRRHHGIDDIDLPNEKEIEKALNAAIDRPLDDLLSIEEFAEKYVVPVAVTAVATEIPGEEVISDATADDPITIMLPLPEESPSALPRAA